MKDGLEYFTDTYLTIIGLILFLTFFTGVLFWTSLKPNKENYKKLERIPLGEGD